MGKGDFGLASAQKPDGTYERIWFSEPVSADEVVFESQVFLLTKAKAKALKTIPETTPGTGPEPEPKPEPGPGPEPGPQPEPEPEPGESKRTYHLSGEIPPELWNRLGTKILPKLRSGSDLKIGINFSVTVDNDFSTAFESDVRQILNDLGLSDKVQIE